MVLKHTFKFAKKDLFNLLESSIKKEIANFNYEVPESLTNFHYIQDRGAIKTECLINFCDLENGYNCIFTDNKNSSYELIIQFNEINENTCEMIYENSLKSKNVTQSINYFLVSIVYKKTIKNRFKMLVEFFNQNLS